MARGSPPQPRMASHPDRRPPTEALGLCWCGINSCLPAAGSRLSASKAGLTQQVIA